MDENKLLYRQEEARREDMYERYIIDGNGSKVIDVHYFARS